MTPGAPELSAAAFSVILIEVVELQSRKILKALGGDVLPMPLKSVRLILPIATVIEGVITVQVGGGKATAVGNINKKNVV